MSGETQRAQIEFLVEQAVAAERERLLAQLPDGMKDCTLVFKECPVGHGRLLATNWIDHGCPYCNLAAERERCAAEIKQLKDELHAAKAALGAEGRANLERYMAARRAAIRKGE